MFLPSTVSVVRVDDLFFGIRSSLRLGPARRQGGQFLSNDVLEFCPKSGPKLFRHSGAQPPPDEKNEKTKEK